MSCALAASWPAAGADDALAVVGKQRAAASTTEWEVRDLDHPVMGPIEVAVQKRAVTTKVQGRTIVSMAFVSCEKSTRKIAVELANASEADARGGMGPVDLPRLVCNAPRGRGDPAMAETEIAASWEIGALGDTLARGLAPAALRRCASIDVLQNVALPPGWARESQRVSLELFPYGRELDAVFAACGETTAWAAERAAPRASAKAAPPASAPPPAAAAGWVLARTTSKGRTNVRAAARLDSAVVVQLPPGVRVLVQAAQSDWWKVKPVKGTGFSGYIRRDRFDFE